MVPSLVTCDLRPIGRQERLLHKNRAGFYWSEVGKENIVPSTKKPIWNKRLVRLITHDIKVDKNLRA